MNPENKRDGRWNRLAVIGVSGVVVVFVTWLYLRPAQMSLFSIRDSLLTHTPIGTGIDEVKALSEKKGWLMLGADSSFSIDTGGVCKSLSVQIRRDPFPYRTAVMATWIFDSSNRLFDVYVTRYE